MLPFCQWRVVLVFMLLTVFSPYSQGFLDGNESPESCWSELIFHWLKWQWLLSKRIEFSCQFWSSFLLCLLFSIIKYLYSAAVVTFSVPALFLFTFATFLTAFVRNTAGHVKKSSISWQSVHKSNRCGIKYPLFPSRRWLTVFSLPFSTNFFELEWKMIRKKNAVAMEQIFSWNRENDVMV